MKYSDFTPPGLLEDRLSMLKKSSDFLAVFRCYEMYHNVQCVSKRFSFRSRHLHWVLIVQFQLEFTLFKSLTCRKPWVAYKP